MLEETYSVRCCDFKGFKFMTRISFLAIFTAQNFGELFLDFKGKKLQYELYSEQGANQEDKGLATADPMQSMQNCPRQDINAN